MQKYIALSFIFFFSSSMADSKCPHGRAIYCPNVEAPSVTGLRGGVVKVKYIVQPSGLVSDVEVLEFGGDPRWVKAVTSTVQTWKYKESDKGYEQKFKFNAVLSK